MTIGYLIEYKQKTSFFFDKVVGDNYLEERKALVNQNNLVKMLQMKSKYLVFKAVLVDMEQCGNLEVLKV